MDELPTTSITVVIAGRTYPLRIEASKEAFVRRMVDEINEKIHHFQLNYTAKDRQDHLAMALLTYATDLHEAQSQTVKAANLDGLDQELSKLESYFSQLLS